MAYTITKQECRDIKNTLRGMLKALSYWTPRNKEGLLTAEERQVLVDDAQSVIDTLNQVYGNES